MVSTEKLGLKKCSYLLNPHVYMQMWMLEADFRYKTFFIEQHSTIQQFKAKNTKRHITNWSSELHSIIFPKKSSHLQNDHHHGWCPLNKQF